MKKKKKKSLPVLDSDIDLLKAFEKKDQTKINKNGKDQLENNFIDCPERNKADGHAGNVHTPMENEPGQDSGKEDFSVLLEASFRKRAQKTVKKAAPMPVKKRLKRYPPVEIELDLHGYTMVGAQVKTRSFIHNCKHQGLFTVRIIVGKGLHSDCGPVLPDVVEDVVLEMKKQELVIFYEWDKKKKSKSGALIVYLKQFEHFE